MRCLYRNLEREEDISVEEPVQQNKRNRGIENIDDRDFKMQRTSEDHMETWEFFCTKTFGFVVHSLDFFFCI